jgi:PAS domain S-box-containing protein
VSGRAEPSKVFWRFYGGLVVLVIVLAIAGASTTIADLREQEVADVQNNLRHMAYVFRELLDAPLADGDAAAISRLTDFAAEQDVRLTVVDPHGRVLADTDVDPSTLDNHSDRPEIADARRDGYGESDRVSHATGEEAMYAAVSVERDGRLTGFVRAAATQDDVNAREKGRVRQVVVGTGALAVAALVVGLTFTRRLDRQFRGEVALMLERDALYDELKASQEALSVNDERFQLVARATSEGLWDWDVTTNAVWWNDGLYGLIGINREMVAPSFDARMDRMHPDDRAAIAESFGEFLKSGRSVWTGEYRLRRANGSYLWVFDRAYIVRDDQGAPTRVIGSMMDVTDRKQAERMKSDFVSFVSHQSRTPLSGMNWMLELAGQSPDLPSEASEYIADARASAARLVTLVNDLLDISRLESGRLQVVVAPVRVGALTRDIVDEAQPLLRDKGHRLEVATADERAIDADEQLLRQAMSNLLANAIKYTPPGGRIRVAVTQDNGVVRWTVTDSGIGIPKTSHSRLFEKFYRAENALVAETEGTGLGLHLVRLIVEQFGGRVWCESDEGQGATFGFALPVSEARS